ncbi:MAG: 4Fe-4S ferredoxin [Desulfuromonas sp.]|nr:MAG: 4Fe-4S ferredoxin [Desulfuromonas sp.]
MSSKVYRADARAGYRENLFDKLSRLLSEGNLGKTVQRGDLVAVKTHFGEKGGHAYIRPTFLRRVVDEIKAVGGKPFLTDSCTLYPGERKESVSALACAVENGFAFAVAGAPLIMCDGLRGHSARRVEVPGEVLNSVDIGLEVLEANTLVVVSHFKCHELTGFGGAIKNLGMGCSSRTGKMEQHGNVAPTVKTERCTSCGACIRVCAHDAITSEKGKAVILPDACVGCARCITICQDRAILINWGSESALVMKKMAEYALGALYGKKGKALFVNFVTQVSPSCDCYGHSDSPIVPDQGILVSTDPVAIDQASADLVNRAVGLPQTALANGHEEGGDKFRGVHPDIDWQVCLEHGEKIGLGSRSYDLIELQPKGKNW